MADPSFEQMPHVLVVDDDRRLRALLRKYLADNGFLVTTASDAADADNKCRALAFDAMILDVMMPGTDGIAYTQRLREATDLPVLLLTAMGEADDRIRGLEAGADDYLVKPFEPRELLLRLTNILRRNGQDDPDTAAARADLGPVRLGDCIFDPVREHLIRDGTRLRLTQAEARLLAGLAARPGEVFSRDALFELGIVAGTARAVDVQVTRLRRKIEPDPKLPRYLQTVRGEGYVLRPDRS